MGNSDDYSEGSGSAPPDDSSSSTAIIILAIMGAWGPIFLLIFCACLPRIKAKCVAFCCATKIQDPEAQEIIDSMQGEWNVTTKPCSCCCCCPSVFARMVVTGNTVAPLNPPRKGQRGPETMTLRPARTDDGTLILDTSGTKAVVFNPEQGLITSVIAGAQNCSQILPCEQEWRKVGWQENQGQQNQGQPIVTQQPTGAGQVSDEIQRLHQLKQQGVLTEEEFSTAKYNLLNPGASSMGPSAPYEQPPPYKEEAIPPPSSEESVPLKQLKHLKQQGLLSDEEFSAAKYNLSNPGVPEESLPLKQY